MNLVFFGTPSYVVPIAEKLKEHFNLVATVTTPDEKVGRKQVITPTPISEFAHQNSIPVLKPNKLTNEVASELKNLNPDLFIVAAYGKIIPQEILDIPRYGSLNVHPSPLPKFRGPSPLQATILNGETTSSITIMQMDAQMDHGPIVANIDFSISDQDTFESLANKVFSLSAHELVKIVPDYVSGKISLKQQDHLQATYTRHISKEDGFIDIQNPPESEILNRMIRAYYPWPNVWTKWNNKVVKFYPDNMIQIEGKNKVSLKEFLNGYPDFPLINF